MKVNLELDFRDAEPCEDDIEGELVRLADMVAEGYREGELHGEDDEGRTTYSGWWRFTVAA